jgi:hypothetical protein
VLALFNRSAVEADRMTARKECSYLTLSLFLLFLSFYFAAKSYAQAVDSDAAKKEGKVVLYGTVVPQATEAIFNSFEKKYGISKSTTGGHPPTG